MVGVILVGGAVGLLVMSLAMLVVGVQIPRKNFKLHPTHPRTLTHSSTACPADQLSSNPKRGSPTFSR